MTTTFTRYFRFGLPDFLSEPWHDQWYDLVNAVDAALYKMLLVQEAVIWSNSHVFAIGDVVISPENGEFWVCAVAHTSAASPVLFSADRVAHPTFWSLLTNTLATQAEAEAGTDNVKYMSPLRVAQAIIAQVLSALSSLSIPTIITGAGTVTITIERFLVFNKTVGAATTVNLPTVASRGGNDLIWSDWAGNAGDITFNPNGTEKIHGLAAAWVATSDGGPGLGAHGRFVPNVTLGGWVVTVG